MTEIPERVAVLETEFRGFKERVSEQLTELKRIMAWGLSIGLMGIIGLWGGIAVIYSQVNDLKAKVDVIEERANETLVAVKAMQASLNQVQLDVAAIKVQSKTSAGNILPIPLLNDGDRNFIQKNIPLAVPKILTGAEQLKIGDVVSDLTTLNPSRT